MEALLQDGLDHFVSHLLASGSQVLHEVFYGKLDQFFCIQPSLFGSNELRIQLAVLGPKMDLSVSGNDSLQHDAACSADAALRRVCLVEVIPYGRDVESAPRPPPCKNNQRLPVSYLFIQFKSGQIKMKNCLPYSD